MKCARISILSILALAVVALSGVPARADLTGFDSYGNLQYSQTTNNTQPMGTPLAFYASRLFYDTAGDITSGTGTSGGKTRLSTLPRRGISPWPRPITSRQISSIAT